MSTACVDRGSPWTELAIDPPVTQATPRASSRAPVSVAISIGSCNDVSERRR
jgi:hypothetical protein